MFVAAVCSACPLLIEPASIETPIKALPPLPAEHVSITSSVHVKFGFTVKQHAKS